MKKLILYLYCFSLLSCLSEPQFSDTPEGNFEACWKILNEKYCYFTYKGIDWQDIHDKYAPAVYPAMTRDSLFNVLNNMMGELQDGHVNLYTPFNIGRYWDWFEGYPPNFDANIQKKYLGTTYGIAGGLKYVVLQPDSIGYIYYNSFSNVVSESNIDYALIHLAKCKGLILDIRNNGGGNLSQVNTIASRFTKERFVSGYIQHKTGKGHDEFSGLYPMYQDPDKYVFYGKPVILLTNRSVFSAANNFVSVMRNLPQVIQIGDRTGGGSGLPFTSELPNGWSLRFSASPIYDAHKQHTEFGIDPDIKVDMEFLDMIQGIDTIIEKARKLILQTSILFD